MSWRTVYITQCEKISLYLDSLLIKKDGEEYKIPLADIGTVIIEDYKATLTIKIINKFIEYNILFITCDDEHNPYGSFVPLNSHFRQYKIVNSQINWDSELKGIFWQEIVKQKLKNQNEILKKLKKDKEVIALIEGYIEGVESDDRTNREGLGAKVYFREMFGKNFKRRVSSDITNSALNYGYAILNSKIARIISGKGLLTYIGVHHIGEYNQFNLASDLVEVYRPIVDFYVHEKINDGEYFSKEHRAGLVNLLNSRILVNGKKEITANAMEKTVDLLIEFFETGVYEEKKLPSLKTVELDEL